MRNYIYVDEKALDSYSQQSGSIVKQEKLPSLKLGLSLLGLSVELAQTTIVTPVNREEKIMLLLRHAVKDSSVGFGRITNRSIIRDNNLTFRIETCIATKMFIPPAPVALLASEDLFADDEELRLPRPRGFDSSIIASQKKAASKAAMLRRAKESLSGFDGLTLWISQRELEESSNDGNVLFLLENSRKTGVQAVDVRSAFSALVDLHDAWAGELRKTIMLKEVDRIGNPESSFEKSFLADPIAALASLGAQQIISRKISTLYEVRRAILHRKSVSESEVIATIGYPLVMVASGY